MSVNVRGSDRCEFYYYAAIQLYANYAEGLHFSAFHLIGERSEPPFSVELSEFSLYLYIYIYNIYIYIIIIYLLIYFRPHVVHVPLTRYAQTSDRPVEVQWSI